MPSLQITAAARLISNPEFKSGWGATLSQEINDVVRTVRADAAGVYQLQVARDRPIYPASIYTAMFWEARHYRKSSTIFTPAVYDTLPLFEEEEGGNARRAMATVTKKTTTDTDEIKYHPLLESIRDSQFTLWPVHIPSENIWVTIILQIQAIPENVRGDTSFDREVVACAIIDPFPEERDERRENVKGKLSKVLDGGYIRFPEHAMIETFTTEDIEESWETGYVAYALCREFIRRMNVLKFREDRGHVVNPDLLWAGFEEHHDIDSYRELMMAACANRTIRKSGYRVRMALEVPSEKGNHNRDLLDPHVDDLPDQWFPESKKKARKTPAPPPQVDQEANAAVAIPVPEQEQEEPQLSDSGSEGHYSDYEADEVDEDAYLAAQATHEAPDRAYSPSQPALGSYDELAENPIPENVKIEEVPSYDEVKTEDNEISQAQESVVPNHAQEHLIDAIPVPIHENQVTPEIPSESTEVGSAPEKRGLDDDAEMSLAKRAKTEHSE
ncbi:hypothetical protein F5Y11DRAFT_322098 [Daldinia sp. FL1419]|nr:hypothetical protein F5Y11DRAFT_322098 [Daldinia sp. FL1419]